MACPPRPDKGSALGYQRRHSGESYGHAENSGSQEDAAILAWVPEMNVSVKLARAGQRAALMIQTRHLDTIRLNYT